jgi:hypothetical protein
MGKISYFYKKTIFKLKPKKNLDKLKLENKNLDNLFNHFGSDKGSIFLKKYPGHNFSRFYEKYLNKKKDESFNMLEIGTYKGASVASFCFYFKRANIFCIDESFKLNFKSSRIKFFNCNTTDKKDLEKLKIFFEKNNCKSFDLIIDDGSHILSDIKNNFLFFFEYLNSKGYYVIEDFNNPKYYEYLDDMKNKEQLIGDFLVSLKEKKFFSSQIINFNSDNKLFDKILNIYIHKGSMILNDKILDYVNVSEEYKKKLKNLNVSDIAFIQKK